MWLTCFVVSLNTCLVLMYAFRFLGSTSDHKRSSNCLKRSLSINNDHAILNAQIRLLITILLNQSRQL